VGQTIDRANVESAVELKTSADGRLNESAKEKYDKIFGNSGWRTYHSPRIWQRFVGWVDNPKVKARQRLAKVVAISAGAAAVLGMPTAATADTIRQRIDPLINELRGTSCPHMRRVIMIDYVDALFDYLGSALDFTRLGDAFRYGFMMRIIAEDW
jgi:hypothetical protein